MAKKTVTLVYTGEAPGMAGTVVIDGMKVSRGDEVKVPSDKEEKYLSLGFKRVSDKNLEGDE